MSSGWNRMLKPLGSITLATCVILIYISAGEYFQMAPSWMQQYDVTQERRYGPQMQTWSTQSVQSVNQIEIDMHLEPLLQLGPPNPQAHRHPPTLNVQEQERPQHSSPPPPVR